MGKRYEGSGGDNSQQVLLQTQAVQVGDGGEAGGGDFIQFVATEVELHQVKEPREGLQHNREI